MDLAQFLALMEREKLLDSLTCVSRMKSAWPVCLGYMQLEILIMCFSRHQMIRAT